MGKDYCKYDQKDYVLYQYYDITNFDDHIRLFQTIGCR